MEQYESWRELLSRSFNEFIATLSAYLPSLLGALVLIATGFLVAYLLRWTIVRLGQRLDQLTQRLSFGAHYLHLRWPVSRILATVVYWLVILFFITAAAESLGLPGLAVWLGQLIVYLPSLLIALLIVVLGVYLGNIVRDRIIAMSADNDLLQGHDLGNTGRYLVIILTVVIGLDQIGVRVDFVEQMLIVLTAAAFFALALAFGLGAGPVMVNIITVNSLKRRYHLGDRIRIEEIEGIILEFTRTAVILDTGTSEVMVPARTFQDKASILLGHAIPGEHG